MFWLLDKVKGWGVTFFWTVGVMESAGQVKRVLPLAYQGEWGLVIIMPKLKVASDSLRWYGTGITFQW